jgi:hypothetical protein
MTNLATMPEVLFREDISPREKIDKAEAAMHAALVDGRFPEMQAPVWNTFCDGLYVRECLLPKGMVLTSAEHKFLHPFFILKGVVSVYWTDATGDQFFQTYQGPCWAVTQPGTKRFLVAHEDTVWITVHRTDEIDPDGALSHLLEAHNNPHMPPGFVPQHKLANAKEAACRLQS